MVTHEDLMIRHRAISLNQQFAADMAAADGKASSMNVVNDSRQQQQQHEHLMSANTKSNNNKPTIQICDNNNTTTTTATTTTLATQRLSQHNEDTNENSTNSTWSNSQLSLRTKAASQKLNLILPSNQTLTTTTTAAVHQSKSSAGCLATPVIVTGDQLAANQLLAHHHPNATSLFDSLAHSLNGQSGEPISMFTGLPGFTPTSADRLVAASTINPFFWNTTTTAAAAAPASHVPPPPPNTNPCGGGGGEDQQSGQSFNNDTENDHLQKQQQQRAKLTIANLQAVNALSPLIMSPLSLLGLSPEQEAWLRFGYVSPTQHPLAGRSFTQAELNQLNLQQQHQQQQQFNNMYNNSNAGTHYQQHVNAPAVSQQVTAQDLTSSSLNHPQGQQQLNHHHHQNNNNHHHPQQQQQQQPPQPPQPQQQQQQQQQHSTGQEIYQNNTTAQQPYVSGTIMQQCDNIQQHHNQFLHHHQQQQQQQQQHVAAQFARQDKTMAQRQQQISTSAIFNQRPSDSNPTIEIQDTNCATAAPPTQYIYRDQGPVRYASTSSQVVSGPTHTAGEPIQQPQVVVVQQAVPTTTTFANQQQHQPLYPGGSQSSDVNQSAPYVRQVYVHNQQQQQTIVQYHQVNSRASNVISQAASPLRSVSQNSQPNHHHHTPDRIHVQLTPTGDGELALSRPASVANGQTPTRTTSGSITSDQMLKAISDKRTLSTYSSSSSSSMSMNDFGSEKQCRLSGEPNGSQTTTMSDEQTSESIVSSVNELQLASNQTTHTTKQKRKPFKIVIKSKSPEQKPRKSRDDATIADKSGSTSLTAAQTNGATNILPAPEAQQNGEPLKKKSRGGRKKKIVTHDEMIARKNRSKERNRVAARRCRQKRKQFLDELRDQIQALNELNTALEKENKTLKKELDVFKQRHNACSV